MLRRRSNFQKLAEPQNEDLQIAFRKGRVPVAPRGNNQPRARRRDDWNRTCISLSCVRVW